MKHLLLALSFLLALPAAAQFTPPPLDSARGKITYATLIQVPSATKAQLYSRALKWLATIEPHTTNVPPVTDATNGLLSANVGLPFTARATGGSIQATLWRELRVTVKEGNATCEISTFIVQPYVASASFTPPSQAQLQLTPAEQYLDRSNGLYYDKQGQPRAYTRSVLGAIAQQTGALVASLKAALIKSTDF